MQEVSDELRLKVERLMRKQVKKKRKCLGNSPTCLGEFMSDNSGQRICCHCQNSSETMGLMAENITN